MPPREFFKDERRENFDDRGSIRLTEVEQNAYRSIITLEVVDLPGVRYFNTKTLPENTHYGYATVLEGDSVAKQIAVKYPLFRLSDTRNEMLWHHYTTNEVIGLMRSFSGSAAGEAAGRAGGTGGAIGFVLDRLDGVAGPVAAGWEWLVEIFAGEGEPVDTEPYTALPVDTPHPTVVKFLSDIPMRFSLRLESWYLANPVVYIVGSDVDASEPTEGEGEYQPPGGSGSPDGGSYGDGNQSSPPADSDPRDFSDELGLVVPGPGTILYEFLSNGMGDTWVALSTEGVFPFSLECRVEENRQFLYAVWDGGETPLVSRIPLDRSPGAAVRNVRFVDSTGSAFDTGLSRSCG